MRFTSYSELQLFSQCKRSWHLKYVRRLQPRKDPHRISLDVGTLFHTAMRQYYDPETSNRDFSDVTAFADAEKALDTIESIDDEEHIEKVIKTAREMFKNYILWLDSAEEDRDRRVEVVAVERKLEVRDIYKFFGFPVPHQWGVIGFIDMLARDKVTGMPLLFEHKTTQATQETWTGNTLFDLRWQAKWYVLMLMALGESDGAIDIVFNVVRRIQITRNAKPPLAWRYQFMLGKKELDLAKRIFSLRISQLAKFDRAVRNDATLAIPQPSFACGNCDFRPVCPSFDDGSDYERLIEDWYEQRPART